MFQLELIMDGQQQNNDAFEWSTKENWSISSKWSKSILSLHKKRLRSCGKLC